ncbi:MAG: arsinothricin resistance N-acetyltransferase ArsN1 family B [Bacteroidia bacterium]
MQESFSKSDSLAGSVVRIIREAGPEDAAAVVEIYNHFILNTIVTFEEEAISVEEMLGRMAEVQGKFPWLVVEVEGRVLGYAYASSWKSRCAYRNSVESTIYLHPEATGRGHGYPLYMELLRRLKELGLHAVIGGIALPNAGSVALHEKCGFRKIGEFVEVGNKFGGWINVGYWQLIN